MKQPHTILRLAAVLLLAFLAGCPVVKHYQLKGAVEAYRRQLRAQGEKLTIAELTPPPPTNGPNGAPALSFAASQLGSLQNPVPAMTAVAPGRARVAWAEAVLPAEDTTNLWPVLAAAVETNQATLDAVRAALASPVLQFDLNYSLGPELPLPHLASLKKAAQWLASATLLDLHEGRAPEAWEDLRATSALATRYGDEPLLISQLVSIAINQILLSATWEAIQAPGWTDDQLAELQAAWASPDFLRRAEASFAMERAMGRQIFAQCRDSYDEYRSMVDFPLAGGPSANASGLLDYGEEFLKHPAAVLRRTPIGYLAWRWLWSYEDELVEAQHCQAALEAVRTARSDLAFNTALKNFDTAADRVSKSHPHADDWLPFNTREVMRSVLLKLADIQMERRLVVAAIAVRRYQLRHGRNPGELRALVPEFLAAVPLDPMDGRPLRYRLDADGSFLLYSVGEDGVDNGGDPSPVVNASTAAMKTWWRARDAVWPRPAGAAEVVAWETEEARRHPQARTVGRPALPAAPAGAAPTNSSQ